MATEDWSNYWDMSCGSNAYTRGGVNHPLVEEFWGSVGEMLAKKAPNSILDVACGTGAVTRSLYERLPPSCKFIACDYSSSALQVLGESSLDVSPVVGDGANLPFSVSSLDVIVSQFGIEYAGLDAIAGLTTFSKPNSIIALLLHVEGGGIWLDSKASVASLNVLEKSQIFPLSKAAFRAAFDSIKTGQFEQYEVSANRFLSAIDWLNRELGGLMGCSGAEMVAKLIGDLISIHDRIEYHDLDKISEWLDVIRNQIKPYENRLASMMSASLSSEDLNWLQGSFSQSGYQLIVSEPLLDAGTALGHGLVLERISTG